MTHRRKSDADVLEHPRRPFGDFFLVPEGGTAPSALRGCAELVREIDEPFDVIACPVGTGETLAGIATGLPPRARALGISTLKGAVSLDREVADLQRAGTGRAFANWSIDHRFHHGGFARTSPPLTAFLADFEVRHGSGLDHVYVGRLMFALFTVVAREEIPRLSVVIAVVTGAVSDRSRVHVPELIV